jgi:hypothetical protein
MGLTLISRPENAATARVLFFATFRRILEKKQHVDSFINEQGAHRLKPLIQNTAPREVKNHLWVQHVKKALLELQLPGLHLGIWVESFPFAPPQVKPYASLFYFPHCYRCLIHRMM